MSTPEDLARQAAAVARVRAARVQRDQSQAALRAAIIDAVNVGAEIRDVAKAAELTRQRIHQIVDGAR